MNILELRLIIDNVKRFAGYREKEVIKDIVKIEIIMDTEEHRVYRFTNTEENYFDYDFKTHLIVG